MIVFHTSNIAVPQPDVLHSRKYLDFGRGFYTQEGRFFLCLKLSQEFVASHPDTPWVKIADMRHHLVHGYYQVDAHIVWLVIQNNLRPLRDQVEHYLSETDWEEWEKQKFTSQTSPNRK